MFNEVLVIFRGNNRSGFRTRNLLDARHSGYHCAEEVQSEVYLNVYQDKISQVAHNFITKANLDF